MANTTYYLIFLFFFLFNLSVSTTNELGVWDNDIEHYDLSEYENTMNSGITDLTNTADVESTDELDIDYFQVARLLIKSFVILISSLALIPLSGVVLTYYGVPTAICALVEVANLVAMGIAYAEFASNRRVRQ